MFPSGSTRGGAGGGKQGEDLQMQQLLHHLQMQQQLSGQQDLSDVPLLPTSQSEEAAWIHPHPEFVVKLKPPSGKVVFINICSHPKIEPWHLQDLLNQQHQGIRIPLSIGPYYEMSYRDEGTCICCDVILNDKTASRCVGCASTKQLVAEFATAAVREKHKIDTQGRISFPKLKYKGKGSPPPQRIRVTRQSFIQAVDATEEGEKTNDEEASLPQKAFPWDGAFASAADAQAFCLALKCQDNQRRVSPELEATGADLVCWLGAWQGVKEDVFSVTSFDAVEPEVKQAGAAEPKSSSPSNATAFKKAFLLRRNEGLAEKVVLERGALASKVFVLQFLLPRLNNSSQSTLRRENNRRCSIAASLCWEFKLKTDQMQSDLTRRLSLSGRLLLRRGGPPSAFAIRFPTPLVAEAASAFVAVLSEEEARSQLAALHERQARAATEGEEEEKVESLLFPETVSADKPCGEALSESGLSTETGEESFLLTLVLPVDAVAAETFSTPTHFAEISAALTSVSQRKADATEERSKATDTSSNNETSSSDSSDSGDDASAKRSEKEKAKTSKKTVTKKIQLKVEASDSSSDGQSEASNNSSNTPARSSPIVKTIKVQHADSDVEDGEGSKGSKSGTRRNESLSEEEEESPSEEDDDDVL